MPAIRMIKRVDGGDVNCGSTMNSDDVEQFALQNLTEERRMKMELERAERKCVNLKMQIDRIDQERSNTEDSNRQLRKILADKQAEVQEIRQEIEHQKQVINDVCNFDRLKNFSDVLEAIARVEAEYEGVRAQLSKEIEICRAYYADIQKMRDEAKNVIDSLLASRKEQQDVINKVESNIVKLNSLMDGVPDENIEHLRKMIDESVALKNRLVALEVEKASMVETLKEITEKEIEGRTRKGDVSSRVDEWKLKLQNDINQLNAEIGRIISEVDDVFDLEVITEEYQQIQGFLNSLKIESDNSNECAEKLRTDKQTCEGQILKRESEIELRKREMEMERNIKKKFETEWGRNKDMMSQGMHTYFDAMDKEILDLSNDIEVLRTEVPLLEKESESVDDFFEKDMESLKNSCLSWKKQLDDETVELLNLRSRDDVVELFETLSTTKPEGGDGDEGFKVDTVSIEKLESSTRQVQDRFKREMDETNQIMNGFQKEMDASAIEVEEAELFLEAFDRDCQRLLGEFTAKQFEYWSAKHENARKVAELDELKKKVVTETATSERVQDLLADLQKNTIRKDEIGSNPLFQIYQTSLVSLTALEKKREKRAQEMKLLAAQLDMYTEPAN